MLSPNPHLLQLLLSPLILGHPCSHCLLMFLSKCDWMFLVQVFFFFFCKWQCINYLILFLTIFTEHGVFMPMPVAK